MPSCLQTMEGQRRLLQKPLILCPLLGEILFKVHLWDICEPGDDPKTPRHYPRQFPLLKKLVLNVMTFLPELDHPPNPHPHLSHLQITSPPLTLQQINPIANNRSFILLYITLLSRIMTNVSILCK